jgi:hypothetical protein
MPKFIDAVRDWPTDAFALSLKRELMALGSGVLPLEKGVAYGGLVDDSNLAVSILRSTDAGSAIVVRVGVFFTEVIAGCNCDEDPQSIPAYCELRVDIDKLSAEADMTLAAD